MKKRKTMNKRVFSAAMASAMVLTLNFGAINVFAAGGTPDTSVTVTGLDAGDKATAFQILKWDDTLNDWALTKAVGTYTAEDFIDGISAEEASAIAAAYATDTGKEMTVSETTATLDTYSVPTEGAAADYSNLGLYYVRVTPKNSNTVYNPIFVSADYNLPGDTGSNSISTSENLTAADSTAVAKKTTVSVDKKMTGTADVGVEKGQSIGFEIDTTIPAYAYDSSQKTFTVTDTLSDPLSVDTDVDVVVKADGEPLTKDTDYTLTSEEKSIKIEFKNAYLSSIVNQSKAIVITYSGKVTGKVTSTFNPMENKATVEFTNNPDYSKGEFTDSTYHWTYSIDGILNGSGTTTQIDHVITKVSAGVTQSSTTTTTEVTNNLLGGATFGLFTDAACTTPVTNINDTATSGSDGSITFNGLDPDKTYYLKETSPADGYKMDGNVYTITCRVDDTDSTTGLPTKYSVLINGNDVSSFTITNTTGDDGTVTTTVTEDDSTFAILNTPGSTLPSTGGIGTRIFYVIGISLAAGAVIVLISRRRVTRK